MDLSIVDLAPIPEDGTATEAFENTVQRAQHAEQLGYTHFWVAEHHDFVDRLASTTPEVLLAYLAAETSDIRIGSGTVLLNHYSPYKVAESFGILDALAPDRIASVRLRESGHRTRSVGTDDDTDGCRRGRRPESDR